jgi:hypothetical protein
MARRQADAVMDQHPTVSLASANNAGAYSESMAYTFGDNQEASRRLRRLAEVYEPETRDLLNAVSSVCYGHRFELALDLGCGPGWSTHLIEATLSPKRIIGLEIRGLCCRGSLKSAPA